MRPAIEEMCPCPVCLKCCCRWVPGLVEMGFPDHGEECLNLEEFGECTCAREQLSDDMFDDVNVQEKLKEVVYESLQGCQFDLKCSHEEARRIKINLIK